MSNEQNPAPQDQQAESVLSERLRAHCVGHPEAKIAWPHRILHDAERVVRAAEDVAHGRGMFGIDPNADLNWAIAHLCAALAHPAPQAEAAPSRDEALREALKAMVDMWASVCRAQGHDPAHMSQYEQAVAALRDAAPVRDDLRAALKRIIGMDSTIDATPRGGRQVVYGQFAQIARDALRDAAPATPARDDLRAENARLRGQLHDAWHNYKGHMSEMKWEIEKLKKRLEEASSQVNSSRSDAFEAAAKIADAQPVANSIAARIRADLEDRT